MNQGTRGKIIAITIILGLSYTLIWQYVEPLNLKIIDDNRVLWRWLLIIATVLIALLVFLFFYPRKYLERFGLDATDTNMQSTLRSRGAPSITTDSDGYHGRIFIVQGDYDNDEMDFNLKTSTHKASSVLILYNPIARTTFYLRINIISKDRTSESPRWIRFDPNISIPDPNIQNEEISYPLSAENLDGYLKSEIDIKKVVSDTFGKQGWVLDKVLIFRIRGNSKIKNVTFR